MGIRANSLSALLLAAVGCADRAAGVMDRYELNGPGFVVRLNREAAADRRAPVDSGCAGEPMPVLPNPPLQRTDASVAALALAPVAERRYRSTDRELPVIPAVSP